MPNTDQTSGPNHSYGSDSSDTPVAASVLRTMARANYDGLAAKALPELMRRYLADLQMLVPYDACQLLSFDRGQRIHVELVSTGYSDELAEVMATDFTERWPKPLWRPVRPGDNLPPTISAESDSPESFAHSPIYRQHLAPEGYQDGMTLELYHRGSYVGLVNFSSKTPGFYVDEIRQRALALTELLGAAISVFSRALDQLPADARAAMVSENRESHPVPGRAMATLVLGTDFIDALEPLFDSQGLDVQYLWNVGKDWYRVVVFRDLRVGSPGESQILLVEEPIDRPFGLSPMEIRVLTHMFACPTNDAVAEALSIGVRTVETHVANILAKLDCRRRSQAIATASRHGLFRPEQTEYANLSWLLR